MIKWHQHRHYFQAYYYITVYLNFDTDMSFRLIITMASCLTNTTTFSKPEQDNIESRH